MTTQTKVARKTRTPITLIASALLGAAMFGAAPAASADESMQGFRVTFAYNTADPAAKIYSQLTNMARKACHERMVVSFQHTRATRSCTKDVIRAVLGAMNRTDVAALHYDKRA